MLELYGCSWIIIQGSITFVESTFNTWCSIDENQAGNVIICVPAKRHRTSKGFLDKVNKCWKNVTHASLGGVTSSKWKVGIWSNDSFWDSAELHQFCQAYGLGRRFCDIISPTEAGIAVWRPTQLLSDLFCWHRDTLNDQFIVPGIFSKIQFVKRRLVLKELGNLFDLSDKTIDNWKSSGKSREVWLKL